MYRQGLGDCFLLTFTENGKEEFNMLIDCGLLQNTTNDKQIMTKVVLDIKEKLKDSSTGSSIKFLDVVVLTHEHADHISGFKHAADIFKEIEFGEVWAAWLDDESHPKYKLVRERFHKQITGLKTAMSQSADSRSGMKEAFGFLVEEFFEADFLGTTETGGRSETWRSTLSKSKKPPRFFRPGTMFPLAQFEDIRVYILGPSEDYLSFTKVNPTPEETYRNEGAGFGLMDSFFAAVGGPDEPLSEMCQPFDESFRVKPPVAEADPFFQQYYGFAKGVADEWRRIDNDWLSLAGGLALNLDTYTNNTCLAFAIEFISSKKVLLFPGDAQFSNWLSWQNLKWRVPNGAGIPERVTAQKLLERTVFYKVGHHGSHNATLKEHGLEMMTSPDLMAMIPTDRDQAKKKTSKKNPRGWEMPEKHLFDRLVERTKGRLVLADETNKIELEKRCNDQNFKDNVQFLGSLVKTDDSTPEPLYIELIIDG
jgi:hypothetical protein